MPGIFDDYELWSKVGGVLGFTALGIAGAIATRRANADKAAQPVNPAPMTGTPAGLTYVVDADVMKDLLAEIKAVHADQRQWHQEEVDRRVADEKRGLEDDIAALRRQNDELRRGQALTHTNQDSLLGMIRELLADPGVAEAHARIPRRPMIEHREDEG